MVTWLDGGGAAWLGDGAAGGRLGSCGNDSRRRWSGVAAFRQMWPEVVAGVAGSDTWGRIRRGGEGAIGGGPHRMGGWGRLNCLSQWRLRSAIWESAHFRSQDKIAARFGVFALALKM